MQKFSFALYGLLQKYRKTTQDLADAVNYPEPVIYEWRYGRGAIPNPLQLEKLARAFGRSPKDIRENHLSLLYSLFWDFWRGPAANLINIEVLPKALPIVADAWSIHPVKRSSEIDLTAIKKHIWYDAELQAAIHELAKPLKNKPIPHSHTTNTPAQ